MRPGKSFFMVTASKKRSNPWLHISDGLRRLPPSRTWWNFKFPHQDEIFSSFTAAQLGEPQKPTSLRAFFLLVRWPRRQLITIMWRWTGEGFIESFRTFRWEKCFKSTSARSDSMRGKFASTRDPSRRQIPSHVCRWEYFIVEGTSTRNAEDYVCKAGKCFHWKRLSNKDGRVLLGGRKRFGLYLCLIWSWMFMESETCGNY